MKLRKNRTAMAAKKSILSRVSIDLYCCFQNGSGTGSKAKLTHQDSRTGVHSDNTAVFPSHVASWAMI